MKWSKHSVWCCKLVMFFRAKHGTFLELLLLTVRTVTSLELDIPSFDGSMTDNLDTTPKYNTPMDESANDYPTPNQFACTKLNASIINNQHSMSRNKDCALPLKDCLQCLSRMNESVCGSKCDSMRNITCQSKPNPEIRSARQLFRNHSIKLLKRRQSMRTNIPFGAREENSCISNNIFVTGVICFMLAILCIPLAVTFFT